jgi:sugar lactone lactonase YvrE
MKRSVAGFLLLAAVALALGCAVTPCASWVEVGDGDWRFAWDPRWSRMSHTLEPGNTHGGVVVDRRGRIYVNTDARRAVMVMERDGSIVDAWGEELAGGLHGMCLAPGGEELWLVHTGRHELLRATLEGEILFRRGWPEESGQYQKAEQFNPTGVTVGPGGDVYVADGYGLGFVHQFRADGTWVRCWGGGGTEPGKFRTPHGIALDERHDPPRLIVADRENHRLQTFTLDGALIEVVEGMLRRPCGAALHGDVLAVPDLAGRVTLLDRDNRLLAQLGDQPDEGKRANNGVPRSDWLDGQFVSPHGLAWGPDGDLYVLDWVAQGRFTRLAPIR